MKTPCQDDPELWVADDVKFRREAMSRCHGCPILEDCLAGAIENREKFGVWGGRDFSTHESRPTLPPPAPKPIHHGTKGGYTTHKRRGVPMCEPCRLANAQAASEARARRAA